MEGRRIIKGEGAVGLGLQINGMLNAGNANCLLRHDVAELDQSAPFDICLRGPVFDVSPEAKELGQRFPCLCSFNFAVRNVLNSVFNNLSFLPINLSINRPRNHSLTARRRARR